MTAVHGKGTATLTANVKANSPSAAIVGDGMVTFYVVNKYGTHLRTLYSSTVINGIATAKLSLTGLPIGSYMVVAVYVPSATGGDFNTSITAFPGKLLIT